MIEGSGSGKVRKHVDPVDPDPEHCSAVRSGPLRVPVQNSSVPVPYEYAGN